LAHLEAHPKEEELCEEENKSEYEAHPVFCSSKDKLICQSSSSSEGQNIGRIFQNIGRIRPD
jgi:hypothetical protein